MSEIARWRAEATRLHREGALEDAGLLYQKLLSLDQADLEARHMLGLLRLQQGRADDALAMMTALAIEAPGDAGIRTHLGLVLQEVGRASEARAEFDQVLALTPDHSLALLYRGNLLLATGKAKDALADYGRLLTREPNNAEALFRSGNALWQMERVAEATGSFEKASQADPNHFGALFNLGTVLMRLERYDEALGAYEKARALKPDHPYLLGTTAGAVLGGCDLGRWQDYRERLTDAAKRKDAVIAPLTFLAFSDDAGLQRQCCETFVADRVTPPPAPLCSGRPYVHGRIRIAYLSADFRRHATADLIAGLIEHHDRTRFEVTAVSFGRDDDSSMRARLVKAFDHFVDVEGKNDAEVAQLLRQHEIDIAIDLKGHTDESRPGILSHRPCPLQVGYLGYPGSIGASWLDYILADATVLPFDLQPFYNEKIVHLPHCYQVNDSTRAIASIPARAEAGLPETGFVFCCFNAAWKISPPVFDVWMRLLAALPESVLWLLDDNPTAVGNLKSAARARGIDPARLVFAARVASAEHLARHALADLFLDTVPYNAHTTASDALWAGLPLLTLCGQTFPSRVAASLLTTLGLPELVTRSQGDYEATALALAHDTARLTSLRRKLADNRRTSSLFDTDLFRRHIEAAYQQMLEIARRGKPPRSFAVPP